MKIEKITIDKFEDEKVDSNNLPDSSGTLKKKIGLKVVNDEGGVFITDTYLDIVDGKSVDDYTKDAYDAKKSNIDKWMESFVNLGKTFNPDTGKVE
tara:strand:- start:398 stop:685 length:288 start_codon:yes stop_codon:yes gene_type:complete